MRHQPPVNIETGPTDHMSVGLEIREFEEKGLIFLYYSHVGLSISARISRLDASS